MKSLVLGMVGRRLRYAVPDRVTIGMCHLTYIAYIACLSISGETCIRLDADSDSTATNTEEHESYKIGHLHAILFIQDIGFASGQSPARRAKLREAVIKALNRRKSLLPHPNPEIQGE